MRAANFVEETTTSIGGTNGDGAFTLTAVAGLPRFSTVFGLQATTVRYVAEHTTSKWFETGIGTVANNVFTRTRPQVTWNGSNYDEGTPAPLQFGSSPAAGVVKIRMGATAEGQATLLPGYIDYALTNRDAEWGGYPLSAHFGDWSTAGGGVPNNANFEFYAYHKIEQAGLLKGWQIECTAVGAASSMKSALYSVDGRGFPAQKLVDFNVVSVATTGLKTDTATATWSTGGPIWLTPGWYVFGFICGPASFSMRGYINEAAGAFSQTPVGRTSAYPGYKNVISQFGKSYDTGMPSVPNMSGTILVVSGAAPWIGMKVAS